MFATKFVAVNEGGKMSKGLVPSLSIQRLSLQRLREANRLMLEVLVQYMVEQRFIAKRIPIEDLFVVGR
jgi:hypothetical protein